MGVEVGFSLTKNTVALAITCSLVAACAKPADQIAAAYVTPLQYENYTCDQLSAEAARVSARAAQAMGVQQQKATGDAVAVGVGVILFWPALFFIKGNGASEAEVARLKGEMDALEQASIQKQCGIQFQRPEPPKPPVRRNYQGTPS
ncbi:MAG: hypothetical protein R3D34_16905 [Nitratireductor sp.]